VLGFTLGLSVVVALLLSFLAPLPREGTLGSRITAGTWRMSGSLKKQSMQRGLVVAQVAVSVMLLAGAGLLTRTMIRLSEVDTGLSTEEVLTMTVSLLTPAEQNDSAATAAASVRYDEMRREIAALPGVDMVALGTLPLRRNGMTFDVMPEGRTLAPGEAPPRAEWRTADAQYFRAAGIPLLQGRTFTANDEKASRDARVVVINKTLADRLFHGEDPVGRRIGWTSEVLRVLYPASLGGRTVVGVVGNTQDGELDADPTPAVFTPGSAFEAGVVIRAHHDVGHLAPAVTRVIQGIAPTALIENVMTIAQYRDQSVAPRRLNAALISLFGLLALLIAAVGIAGVLAFSVSTRTVEIGIRMSLGADSGQVARMILKEGGVLLAAGLVVGVAGAFVGTRVIQGLLFGVAPHDPITFIAVVGMMALIGMVACWIPAIRAARIDPAISMRSA
jgi:putative ABC transport system permease protein